MNCLKLKSYSNLFKVSYFRIENSGAFFQDLLKFKPPIHQRQETRLEYDFDAKSCSTHICICNQGRILIPNVINLMKTGSICIWNNL